MIRLSIIFIIAFSLESFVQIKPELPLIKFTSSTVFNDSTKISVIPYTKSRYPFFKEAKSANLDSVEMDQIDSILKTCMTDYNLRGEKLYEKAKKEHPHAIVDRNHYVIAWKGYYRQYVVVINSKGEKEVWINCFCRKHDGWESQIIIMQDGGNCYFNLKINLKSKKYYELMVNGVA